jgi:general secretion pathway protein A
MSREYWGLREMPFRGAIDPRHYYPSPTHEEALARLEYLVAQRRRVGLLLGGDGSGKSMVLEVFARRLRRRPAQLVNVNLFGAGLHEFLWLLAAEVGVNPDRQDDIFRLWRAILDRLVENRYQQLDTVMLLDDGGEARPEVLEHVVRLAQCDGCERMTIVMATGAASAGRLSPRLLELAELRVDIEAWEPADTLNYVTAAIEQAGRSEPIFTEQALHRLHDLCGGIPRRVNQLASMALFSGASRKLTEIDPEVVDATYHEMGVVQAVA